MALKKHSRRTGSGFASCASPVQPMTEIWDMKHLDDNDVRQGAFLVWKQAEEPAGRMDEFGYEAERQLERERLEERGSAGKAPWE